MSIIRSTLTAALLCVLAWTAAAQQPPPAPIRVTGKIQSAQGAAIPGAAVRATHVESGRAWVSWTDESGKFDLPGLPPGRYRVEARQLGFAPASTEVEFTTSPAPAIELKLAVYFTTEKPAAAAAPSPAPAAPAQPGAEPEKPAPVPSASGQGPTPTKPAQMGAGTSPQGTPPTRGGQPAAAGGPGMRLSPQQQQQMAEAIRQRMQQGGGFQQVDPTVQSPGAGAAAVPGQEGVAQVDTGPLGEASSSDAFLISGTVGRGANPGGGLFGMIDAMGAMAAAGAFGGIPGSEGGVFPGQGGAPPGFPGGGGMGQIMIFGGPGGAGPGGGAGGGRGGAGAGRGQQGQRGAGQRGGNQRSGNQSASNQADKADKRDAAGDIGAEKRIVAGSPGGFGQGMEALWGMQRVLRQQANRIRFSFYNRYGHSIFDARSYSLTNPDPAKVAHYRERFGVNLGGPLYIPKVYNGRDKTFFFINYDFQRDRNPIDTFATVPLAAERNGDFSVRGIQLFDPTSNLSGPRTSFGTSIPSGRLDAAAVGLLRFIPLPNLPGTVQNFHLQARVPNSTDRFNIRIMHTITPKLSFQGIYNLSSGRSKSVQNFPALGGEQSTLGQNLTFGLTQQYSQRLTHDTRFNWSRNRVTSLNRFAFVDNIAGGLGIIGISPDPINFGVPAVSYTNFSGLNDPVPALRRNETYRFTDNLSYARTKHTLRGGVEFRRMHNNNRNDPVARGAFTFTGLMTSQLDSAGRPIPGTGLDFADFLLGLPQSTNVRFGSSRTYFRSWALTTYFQDDWRVHPRFSVNWGIRYELTPPPIELFDKLTNLDVNSDFTAVAVVLPGQSAPFSGQLPRSLVRSDDNNWAPRLGLAWRLPNLFGKGHNATVRTGYSMFYNGSVYNQLIASMANQPPFAQAQVRVTSSRRVLTLEDGFPQEPPGSVLNTIAVDPNYRLGYAQIWNLSMETQITTNLNATLTYTGTKGTHLDLLRSPNRALPTSPLATEFSRRIPNASEFTYDTFGASSIYHAMELRVQRRLTRGFMIMGTYTFGKSLDNASSIGGGQQVVVQDDRNFAAERGLSSFNVRHRFNTFYMYELPFGERKRWARKGWTAATFGNWSFNGNTTISSGTPFTARVLGSASNNSGTGSSFSERPNQVGDPLLPRDQRTPLHFFDTTAFVLPLPGVFGNASRNSIPGPGTVLFNFSLARWARLGKDGRHRLDFRWEIQNLLNTPNFTGLSTVVNSTTYGRVTGTRPMRTMDFNLRVSF